MGLWLKCPKCQAANPLDLKACTACNASLENLPAAKRIYIVGTAAPAAPKPAEPKAAPKAAPKVAPKAATKAPAAPKAEAAAAPVEVALEVIASTEPPPKRPKGPKAVRRGK